MDMGLLGALGGAAEAVGQVADQSIKNRYEMDRQAEFEKIVAIREERAAALREKYKVAEEDRGIQRQKDNVASFKEREAGLINEAGVSGKREASRKAALESGLINGKEYIADERESVRADREDRKLSMTSARDAANERLKEARLDLDAKRIEALIAKTGGSNSAISAFVQNMEYLKKQFPKETPEQIFDRANSAKAKQEEYTVERGTDDFGKPTEKVVIRGTGKPPTESKPASSGKQWVYKDGKMVQK